MGGFRAVRTGSQEVCITKAGAMIKGGSDHFRAGQADMRKSGGPLAKGERLCQNLGRRFGSSRRGGRIL
jgi:hypothetical protein